MGKGNYGFAYLKDLDKIPEPVGKDDDDFSSLASDAETLYKSNEFGLGNMPATSDSQGTYEPQQLNARHREILRLAALGYKYVDIARILGITPVTVGYVVNSPLGKSFLAEIHEARTGSVKDVHNRLQEMSPLASEIMLDIMSNGKKENNRLRAAEKVLEMTGHKGENKHMHLHTQLSADEIMEMKRTAKIGPATSSEKNKDKNIEDIPDAEYTEEEGSETDD